MTDQQTSSFQLRPMSEHDLQGVLAVQASCYPPALQEPGPVVLGRLRAAPAFVLAAGDADGVCGYVFAYPSRLGAVTALGAGFEPASVADTLYIHDLAVAPRALGQGLAGRLVAQLFARARTHGLAHAALVAVQDSRAFWEGQGFEANAPGPDAAAALAAYPADALYMTRAAGAHA